MFLAGLFNSVVHTRFLSAVSKQHYHRCLCLTLHEECFKCRVGSDTTNLAEVCFTICEPTTVGWFVRQLMEKEQLYLCLPHSCSMSVTASSLWEHCPSKFHSVLSQCSLTKFVSTRQSGLHGKPCDTNWPNVLLTH